MWVTLILMISIILQFAAAFLALRLIRITGRRVGWVLIAAAVTLMAIRRCITLFSFLSGGDAAEFLTERATLTVSLTVSALLAVGMAAISPLFVSMKQSKGALRESQRMFATLISNLPGAVYRCRNEKDWPADFVSEAIFPLTGHSPSDFTERKIAFGQLIRPDDREPVWNKIQEALREKRSYRLNYCIRTASGEEKWVLEQGQGIFSPSGELLYLEGFVTDMTEQKRAEAARRESEERFRRYFELGLIGMAITSPAKGILEVNDKICEILGYERNELMKLT